MDYNTLININWLKENAKLIHYFGLGFIQIKLNENERIHFYTNKLARTVQEEEIHNHRYNFVSRILKGIFTQTIYEIDYSGADFILTQETCKEEKISFPKVPCNIIPVFTQDYDMRDSYYINHNTFHTVDSTNAITYIKRSGYKKDYADIIYPKDKPPICPFSVKIPENTLWALVESMLK
jgi:hypothetical protein